MAKQAPAYEPHILPLERVGMADVALVGGKAASLGEMMRHLGTAGVRIPPGFVVTTAAFRLFLAHAGLHETARRILTGANGARSEAARLRRAILRAEFPKALERDIAASYAAMGRFGADIACRSCRTAGQGPAADVAYSAQPNGTEGTVPCMQHRTISVAVRSSATAEDHADASFAGIHESYLGVSGITDVLAAVRRVMASLFTDRAVSYRRDKGLHDPDVLLSVAVQRMVASGSGASGVMFTADPESGFRDVVVINATWGLGEMLVQGRVQPDEYLVSKKAPAGTPLPVIARRLGKKEAKMISMNGKNGGAAVREVATTATERRRFVLTEEEAARLAAWGVAIERHYAQHNGTTAPMDIEWAKDGGTGDIYIVQARPETVHAAADISKVKEYRLLGAGRELARGIAVGDGIASGISRVIADPRHIAQFKKGEVLVTRTTDPDWEPVMKAAAAIVTETGSRTSHAAIIARELGIPAIVGAAGAMRGIPAGRPVTVDATGAAGTVLDGAVRYETKIHDIRSLPETRTNIMLNIATPDTAFRKSFLPHRGVGLARLEFIIAGAIGVHPLALAAYPNVPPALKRAIDERSTGWDDKKRFYIDQLCSGIATIALAFHPHPVIVRFSDFKSNEYRTLLGGTAHEPQEENPMIGWRGASRYYDPRFREAFLWECAAIKKVRDEMHLTNVIPMVPFCRTPAEGEKVLALMADAGLVTAFEKNRRRLPARTPAVSVYAMCEVPSNVILADRFLDIFDGMSIGSNDLTQLTLGLDRDAGDMRHVGDETDAAVQEMVRRAIRACLARGKYIGICGQAPSDHPDFAAFLVTEGIASISLNPDAVIKTIPAVAALEKKLRKNKK